MLLTAIALMSSAASDEWATTVYVECVESEVMRLEEIVDLPATIVETAIANCERLVEGAARDAPNQAPPEVIMTLEKERLTPDELQEFWKIRTRDAAREMALYVLNKSRNGGLSDAPNP